MGLLAIIGGSGFASLPGLVPSEQAHATTGFGTTSAPLVRGVLKGLPVLFLARHGPDHSVPPHRIDYRANIAALAEAGVDRIVALGAVGCIGAGFAPGVLCVPEQLIDYTHGRAATFYDGGASGVVHVDLSWPFSPDLRHGLLAAARTADVPVQAGGTYAVTQGPRLETAAEVRRLQRDGCDIVGMTAMPEAALARERGIGYATLAFVVSRAAGLEPTEITMDEIQTNIARCSAAIGRVLDSLAGRLATTA